jgi:hypothetical protein
MASQTSEEALQRVDKSEFVVMSTRTQNANVSGALSSLFGGVPPQEGQPALVTDWQGVQESHAALLVHWTGEVRRADEAHRVNLVKTSQLRRKRKETVKGLKQQHRDLRKSFTGTYGPEALPLVGLDAQPALRFVAVREQLREVVTRMRNPELALQLPTPRAGQQPLDLVRLADALETHILAFEALDEEIRRMRKVVDESLAEKRRVLKAHRRIYVNVVGIQERYYRLVGLDDLADRIRSADPPRRSEPQTETPDETPPPSPPTSSTA